MYAYDREIKIAIWGIGKLGKKCYYRYRSKYQIVCFIDSKASVSELYGLPVIRPDQIQKGAYKIVVASTFFGEIAAQCNAMELFYYDDFMSHKAFELKRIYLLEVLRYAKESRSEQIIHELCQGRLRAIVLGNCQTQIISKLLECSEAFRKRYILMEIPAVNAFRDEEKDLFFTYCDLQNACDLLITQAIKENNRWDNRFSNRVLIPLMGAAQVIRIPVLYFDVYFPQAVRAKKTVMKDVIDVGIYPYGDGILDELASKYSLDEIVEIVSMDNFYSKEFMERYYAMWENDFREREKACDIKLLDFIKEHYREEQLFYTRNHPSRQLLEQETREILRVLSMEPELLNTELVSEMDFTQEFIYPSVYQHLGIKWKKNYYFDCESREPRSFREEVSRYLSYLYDLKEK